MSLDPMNVQRMTASAIEIDVSPDGVLFLRYE